MRLLHKIQANLFALGSQAPNHTLFVICVHHVAVKEARLNSNAWLVIAIHPPTERWGMNCQIRLKFCCVYLYAGSHCTGKGDTS